MASFVKAEWTNLVLLNYAVPDDVLAPYLGDLEIDRWQGSGYVSVVGLHFGTGRVIGLDPILPDIRHFTQWNLRAYVRYGGRNGIVFIKEFVPSPIVSAGVRLLYRENYHAACLRERLDVDSDSRSVAYTLDYGGRRHSMSARSTSPAAAPAPGSLDHFVVERYTGHPAGHRGIRFHVEHRPWNIYKMASYVLDIDYRVLYGDRWAFLNDRAPDGIAWCDGSPVEVSWPVRDR